MILVIDNYDSFTWNLIHYLRQLGAAVDVVRNDALTAAEALAGGADAFLISPGPGGPVEAGISLDLVAACAEARRPLLGICLGHQAIAAHFGGTIEQASRPVHGKTSSVQHDGTGLFATLPSPLVAARYHSLIVEEVGLPDCLAVNARTEDAPEGQSRVMGLRHRTLPIHSVQFHPESVASEHGHALLANFLRIAGLDQGATRAPFHFAA
jgi:anthranilate synthase component II